jgi:tRNA1Val (adenine37-N6)-methyltransferase
MNPLFRFRQFAVRHDLCAMKVGTDGVLLGACAEVQDASAILDVGTGSGVIAIMLAQRCHAVIEGVEIDEASARQAAGNAASCPWHDRINIVQSSFQEYSSLNPCRFDVVVCNSPFFTAHLKSPDEARNLVRHAVSLDYRELAGGVRKVLRPSGKWWLILPVSETERFLAIAGEEGFRVNHTRVIFPKEGKQPHRMILSMGAYVPEAVTRRELTIRNAEGEFSEEYKKLTGDFYLA